MHTRLLRALLRTSDSAQYEDEEDTAENFGVMRRNVNVLTWPEIFRQYLYLIVVSTRPYRNTASKKGFQSTKVLKKHLIIAQVNHSAAELSRFSSVINKVVEMDDLVMKVLQKTLKVLSVTPVCC